MYISANMPDSEISQALGIRQQLEGQRRQSPLDEMLQNAVSQGQRSAATAAGVPGMDSAATGWQNPAAPAPSGAAGPVGPPAPQANNPAATPPPAAAGGGRIPSGGFQGSANVSGVQDQMADPLARLSRSSSWEGLPAGATQQLTGQESLALRRQSNPSFGTPADAINMMLGTGPYAGMLPGQYLPPGLSNLNPAERMAMISRMNDLNQTGIGQQAENRLQTQLLGVNGQPGTMALAARQQQLAEDQHGFNSSQSVANQNAYRSWLLQRSQNGQTPPTQEEAQQFLSRLPQGAPGSAGAAPAAGTSPQAWQPSAAGAQPAAAGPGFQVPAPSGTSQVTHPWGSIQNQLDATWRQAMAQSAQPGPGGAPGAANDSTLTSFVHALASNGVNLSPENSMAIRQYMLSKVGPEAAERWWQTRDSVLPDLGLTAESPAATARRMLRQSAGIGASSVNRNTPTLLRFGPGALLPRRQYQ